MKRVCALMMLLLLLVGVAMMPVAMAEATAQQVTFDATPIVAAGIVLLGTALGAVLLWLTYKYLVPLLKVPIVGLLAKWAVDYAERELGRGNGDTKFDVATAFVVNVLRTIHINVEAVQIKAAIISAWTALNLAQINAKIKEATSATGTGSST